MYLGTLEAIETIRIDWSRVIYISSIFNSHEHQTRTQILFDFRLISPFVLDFSIHHFVIVAKK